MMELFVVTLNGDSAGTALTPGFTDSDDVGLVGVFSTRADALKAIEEDTLDMFDISGEFELLELEWVDDNTATTSGRDPYTYRITTVQLNQRNTDI